MLIELTYRLTPSGSDHTLQYDAVITRPTPNVARLSFRSLREVEGRHLLSTRSNYDVFISADQFITSSPRAFIVAYHTTAVRWWLRYQNDDGSWTSSVEVVPDKDGDVPQSFIDDIDTMMEVRFKMIQKYPN